MKCCCCRKKLDSEQIAEFLRTISMGKFATKLYYNGKAFKGSITTGILTILFTLFFVGYVLILFQGIINRENYSLDLDSHEISCLRAIFKNDSKSSILTDQIYSQNLTHNYKQIEITVAEYANVIKNKIYYIYSDNAQETFT